MACDFRLAAESATFGQPEVNLGIIPGFGGTQRLPRLVGEGKALEMNLPGTPISASRPQIGPGQRGRPRPRTVRRRSRLGAKARRAATARGRADQEVSHKGDLDDGIAAEKQGFATVFQSADAREGISAFIRKRTAKFEGK